MWLIAESFDKTVSIFMTPAKETFHNLLKRTKWTCDQKS